MFVYVCSLLFIVCWCCGWAIFVAVWVGCFGLLFCEFWLFCLQAGFVVGYVVPSKYLVFVVGLVLRLMLRFVLGWWVFLRVVILLWVVCLLRLFA